MATKKLENMSVAELRSHHKRVTGRSTKESNKQKLIDAIEQHTRLEQRLNASATPKAKGRGKKGSAAPVASESADETEESEDSDSDSESGSAPSDGEPKLATPSRRELRKLSVGDLQRLYEEKIGRPTGSDDVEYLIWKIVEAAKGRIKVGASQPNAGQGPTVPITLRFPVALTEKLDELWKRKGHRSRPHLLELAMATGFRAMGEDEIGAEFERRRGASAQEAV